MCNNYLQFPNFVANACCNPCCDNSVVAQQVDSVSSDNSSNNYCIPCIPFCGCGCNNWGNVGGCNSGNCGCSNNCGCGNVGGCQNNNCNSGCGCGNVGGSQDNSCGCDYDCGCGSVGGAEDTLYAYEYGSSYNNNYSTCNSSCRRRRRCR